MRNSPGQLLLRTLLSCHARRCMWRRDIPRANKRSRSGWRGHRPRQCRLRRRFLRALSRWTASFADRVEWACARTASAFRSSIAAIARGNGIAVRARLRMAEKRANALIQLRADDVLELASLRMHFGFVDGEGVLEEALRKEMAADDVARALPPHRGELRCSVLEIHETQFRHATQYFRRGLFRNERETSGRTGSVEASHQSGLPFLAANPNLL